jgi:hypothetical protein
MPAFAGFENDVTEVSKVEKRLKSALRSTK